MRAVRLHGVGDLRLEEVPDPAGPGPGEVRIEVLAAGVCGSDMHNYASGQWISKLPVTPGHEVSGRVAGLGEGVAGLAVGDLVVADSRVPCATCPRCAEGRENLCAALGFLGEVRDGGFAEALVMPAGRVRKVDGALAPEVAVLAEPLAVALRVVRRLSPEPGEPVFVLGGGTIGTLVALALGHLGLGPVLLAERDDRRRALACAVSGASPAALRPGVLAGAPGGRPVRLAVEATGSKEAFAALVGALPAGSRVAMVGIFHGEAKLALNLVVEREIELRGCSVFENELDQAVSLLPALAGKLGQVVGDPVPLDRLPEAFPEICRGRAPALKTLVRPRPDR